MLLARENLAADLSDATVLELLLLLRDKGFQWRKWPRKVEMRFALRLLPEGECAWYSGGVRMVVPYLQCVLQSQSLFANGLPFLPHFFPRDSAKNYQKILEGCLDPAELLAAAKQPKEKKKSVIVPDVQEEEAVGPQDNNGDWQRSDASKCESEVELFDSNEALNARVMQVTRVCVAPQPPLFACVQLTSRDSKLWTQSDFARNSLN